MHPVNNMNITRYRTASGVLATIAAAALAIIFLLSLISMLSIIDQYNEFFDIMIRMISLLGTLLTMIAFALFSAFIWFISDIRRSKFATVSFIFLAISSLLSASGTLIMILYYKSLFGPYDLPGLVFNLILCAAYALLAIYFPRQKNGKILRNSCAIVIAAFTALVFISQLVRYFYFFELIYMLLYMLFPASVLIFVFKCAGNYIPVNRAVRRNAEENGSLVSDMESQLLYLKSLYEAGQINDKEYEYRRRDLLDRL
jgi:hypothetical protein